MTGTIARRNAAGLSLTHAGYYSQCVRVANPSAVLYLAGQVARDENGANVGIGDVTRQTEQVIANLRRALAAEGADLANLVKVTIYVIDIRDAAQIDAVRRKHFVDNLPASTFVEVSKLNHPEWLIEIEGIAVIP